MRGRTASWCRGAGALLLAVGGLAVGAPAASAGTGLGVVPDFPTPVVVGTSGVPASLTVTNVSDGAQAALNVTLSMIQLTPSCSNFEPGCVAGGPDPEAFTISATGSGAAGTACEGMVFTIAVTHAPSGTVTFAPPSAVVLGPPSAANELDACTILFTFAVNKIPNHDSFPATPGVQTNQVGFVLGVHDNGVPGVGSGSDVTTVAQASPAVTTQATPSAQVGQPISDTATLSAGANPTGTITFTLFGPDDSTCAGPPVFTSTVPVNGNGNYPSAPFTPNAAGTYRWIAAYSGDANNAAATTACNDPNESSVVQPAMSITTQATPSAQLGQPISDTATVTNGDSIPITFQAFGPNDATCSGPPAFTSTTTTDASGFASSGAFTPTQAGTYRWVVSATGQSGSVTSPCNAPNETSVVSQDQPTIVTQATATAQMGGTITDTATLSGGTNPTGTITFTLFGPDEPTCAGPPVFTDTVPVNGNGNYASDPFTPSTPGTYRWVASYSGDANNAPAVTACNDPNETSVVSQDQPTIVTQASPGVSLGGAVTDTATLSDGTNPTGTITFELFGPDDATCAGPPVFTSTVPVNGNGDYTSEPFTPPQPGTYQWIAAYSGDANNAPATTACGDPNESVVVSGVDCDAPPPQGAIVGTRRGDELEGTSGDDVIFGRGGDDEIEGRGGNDTICAGPGDDEVEGGRGDDVLHGEGGDDELEGGAGDDELRGGAGEDELSGGAGDDELHGGGDEDELDGGAGDDELHGGGDEDELDGGGGEDDLDGGGGRDRCDGGRGTDTGTSCERSTRIP